MNKYKLSILLSMLSLCNGTTIAQTENSNFVVTNTMLDASATNSVMTVQYYDGLGRPNVLAAGGVNTSGTYIYTMKQYDERGREKRNWLPAAGTTSPVIINATSMQNYSDKSYGSNQYAYSDVAYDELSRQSTTSTPGKEWYSGNKKVKTEYITNTASIKRYVLTSTGDISTTVQYYSPGTLTGEKTTDEDGHTTEVYKDLLDNVVLERRNGNNDTYYVYENGLLRAVIPPLYQNSSRKSTSLLYKYKYDTQGRCIEKTLPGPVTIKYWYDKDGRLAFMQDGRLRSNSKYRFFLYDGLNRLVVQGLCKGVIESLSQKTMTAGYLSGKNNVANTGYYSSFSDALSSPELETASYYDGYQCLDNAAFTAAVSRFGLKKTTSVCTTSLLTAQIVVTTKNERLHRVFYYDTKGRCIESFETFPNKTCVQTTTSYSFTDKPLVSSSIYRMNGTQIHKITNSFEYNAKSDLLMSNSLQLDAKSSVRLFQNVYNNLGQISQINIGNDGKMYEKYTYDVHGWLKEHSFYNSSLSSLPVFKELLKYADGTNKTYNGNISAIVYNTTDSYTKARGFNYKYDGLNRLVSSEYKEGADLSTTPSMNYSETFTYDENSSLTSLSRYGKYYTGTDIIDKLTYSYSGNRLTSVTDGGKNSLVYGTSEFKDVTGTSDYSYDASGALTCDKNKGISVIQYDMNGYPTRIQFSNGNVTEYVYTSDGKKLKVIHRTAVSGLSFSGIHTLTAAETASVDSTIYISGFEFYNTTNSGKYYYANGYLDCDRSGNYSYHYLAKDYLGNTRSVFNANGAKEQVNNYYAYGSNMNDVINSNDIQTHKYNGKELDRMHGLDLYDYSARQYDPVVGRFSSMDPLCEKYYHINPYAYCNGNPVMYVDPDGKCPLLIPIIVMALKGAAIEAATEYGFQVLENWHNSKEGFTAGCLIPNSWSKIGMSAGEGALTFGAGTGKKIAVKAVTCYVNSVIDNYEDGMPAYSLGFASNVTGELLGAGAQKLLSSRVRFLLEMLKKSMSSSTKTHLIKEVKECYVYKILKKWFPSISNKDVEKIITELKYLVKECPEMVEDFLNSEYNTIPGEAVSNIVEDGFKEFKENAKK